MGNGSWSRFTKRLRWASGGGSRPADWLVGLGETILKTIVEAELKVRPLRFPLVDLRDVWG